MELKFKQFQLEKKRGEKMGKGFNLTPIELKDFIDFEVKRIYYVTELEGATGQHCHKEEKELFICIKGSLTATVDKGNGKEEMAMKEGTAFYIGNYVWHEFKDAKDDAIMLALSSTNYKPDRSDYIEDYEEYKKIISEK